MIIDFATINIVIDKYRLAIVSLEYETVCENNLKFVFFFFFGNYYYYEDVVKDFRIIL